MTSALDGEHTGMERRYGHQRVRSPVVSAFVFTVALVAIACGDPPWPDPPPPPDPPSSEAKYLVVIPGELDVHIDDHTKDVSVLLVGKVFDRWGIPLEGENLTFSLNPPTAGFDLQGVTAEADTTRLIIRSTATSQPDRTVTINVAHAAPGLSIDIPVRVMYNPSFDHGVLHPSPTGEYPTAGLASGAGAAWRSNLLRAFVRRARFERFDPLGVPPSDDIASGTVLSSMRTAWREPTPWATGGGDMDVPDNSTSEHAVISLVPVLLANDDPATGGTDPANLVTDIQGGADIIEGLLIGAKVEIGTVAVPGDKVEWDWLCAVLDERVSLLTDPLQKPDPSRLMLYMVARTGSGAADTPMTCAVGKLPSFPTSQAIFIPEGPVESQTIAHEIVHALSLVNHVVGLDYLDNNLMVVPVSGAERLRDRLTVGQSFRAALDATSWIVGAGKNKSNKLDCSSVTDIKKCPLLKADISARVPP